MLVRRALALVVLAGASGCAALPYLPMAASTTYQTVAPAPQPIYVATPQPIYAPPARPPIEIFTPPPGPVTDLCSDRLAGQMQMRKMFLDAQGDTNQAAAQTMNDQIRSGWLDCQAAYDARQRAAAMTATAAATAPPPSPPTTLIPAVVTTTTVSDDPAPVPGLDEATAVVEPDVIEEPKPRKLTAAERKAADDKRAAREAERLKKKQEREAREQEAAETAQRVAREYCGPKPQRRAWNGIYQGLEDFFKSWANDPDSIDFEACTDAEERNPTACWVTICKVRGKNGFGGKILNVLIFGKSSRGWKELKR